MTITSRDTGERTVWILEHYSVPPGEAGFVRQYEFARYLQGRGWNTRVFASAFNHKTHRYFRKVKPMRPVLDVDENGVEYTWLFTTPYTENSWRRYLNILSYLVVALIACGRKPRPSVVVGASPHLFAPLAAWLIARRYRVPFVMEVQDLWPESLVQLGLSNQPIISVLAWLEKFLYGRAQAIITLTDGISDGVRAKLKTHKPVVLIPTGADPVEPISDDQRSQGRSAHGWDDQYIAIWTGAHGKANHLDTIIEAARIQMDYSGTSSIRWVLLGDGPEKARLMESARYMANVEFLPPVPSSEVAAILQLADVGLIVHQDTPAVHGARPTKLAEYMATGLPIISDLQGEPSRLIDQASCGITVPAMNPAALADAVQLAANDPEQFRTQGQNGQEFLMNEYSRSIHASRLAVLLDEVSGLNG